MKQKTLLNCALAALISLAFVAGCADDSSDEPTSSEAQLRGGSKADGGVVGQGKDKDKDAGKPEKKPKPDGGDDDGDSDEGTDEAPDSDAATGEGSDDADDESDEAARDAGVGQGKPKS